LPEFSGAAKRKRVSLRFVFGFALAFVASLGRADARSCVWKVTDSTGGKLYLAGSWHALRSRDYPLPAAFKTAFEASTNLAFEISPNDLHNSGKAVENAGTYPRSDSLKNHVSPVTYNFLQVSLGFANVSEAKFSRYRPWYLVLALQSPGVRGMSGKLGVERHFERRAAAAGAKPVTGLETLREHVEVFSGLSDRTSEALLLQSFGSADNTNPSFGMLMNAWRKGDAEFLASATRASFRGLPGMSDRLLSNRNRNWIPKIEGFLRSGKTYFVVVGAAHMGGTDGVLALLKARGYRIEQL
jgi:uncharacterized protein YbaP (TraB family)